jgi:membrane fusion protein (multidrug efflux system)
MDETKQLPEGKQQSALPPAPRSNRVRALLVVLVIGVVAAVGGYMFLRYTETYESTDDAQVDAHLAGISARIQGTVTAVYVDDNQFVKAGQLLVEMDPSDYEVALAQTRADLAQSQAELQAQNPNVPITQTTSETSIAGTQADLANAEAAIAAAESDAAAAQARWHEAQARLREAQANNAKAQADVARYKTLVEKDEVARQQYDQVVATAQALAASVDSAAATVDSANASVQAARKVVDQRRAQLAQVQTRFSQVNRNAPRQVAISQANVRSRVAMADAAKAKVDQAVLNLSYTKVTAPVDGIVSKRSVEVGSRVQSGQQLFSVAMIGDMWVTANFKETQLKRMRPGQRVTISTDAFDQNFSGRVESMPAATGAISSLLPPENATGNYVKVVQRLPVRIRFDKDQSGLDRLRPGMSVEPKVWLQ